MPKKVAKSSPAPRKRRPVSTGVSRASGEQERHYWVYDDLVGITGKTRLAIWKAYSRKEFDVENLKSVIYWSIRHAKPEIKQELLPYVMLHSHAKNPGMPK